MRPLVDGPVAPAVWASVTVSVLCGRTAAGALIRNDPQISLPGHGCGSRTRRRLDVRYETRKRSPFRSRTASGARRASARRRAVSVGSGRRPLPRRQPHTFVTGTSRDHEPRGNVVGLIPHTSRNISFDRPDVEGLGFSIPYSRTCRHMPIRQAGAEARKGSAWQSWARVDETADPRDFSVATSCDSR